MKKLILSLVACSATSSIFGCFGCVVEHPFTSFAKTYIQADQLGFSEEGIYIKIDDQWLQTTTLYSDDIGMYITNLREYRCSEQLRSLPAESVGEES